MDTISAVTASTTTTTTTTATTTAPATATPTATASTAATTPAAVPAAGTFTERLDNELKRITANATKTEALKNGATLYLLANGREVEDVAGKSPYVVKAGTGSSPAQAPTSGASATSGAAATSGTASTSVASGTSSDVTTTPTAATTAPATGSTGVSSAATTPSTADTANYEPPDVSCSVSDAGCCSKTPRSTIGLTSIVSGTWCS